MADTEQLELRTLRDTGVRRGRDGEEERGDAPLTREGGGSSHLENYRRTLRPQGPGLAAFSRTRAGGPPSRFSKIANSYFRLFLFILLGVAITAVSSLLFPPFGIFTGTTSPFWSFIVNALGHGLPVVGGLFVLPSIFGIARLGFKSLVARIRGKKIEELEPEADVLLERSDTEETKRGLPPPTDFLQKLRDFVAESFNLGGFILFGIALILIATLLMPPFGIFAGITSPFWSFMAKAFSYSFLIAGGFFIVTPIILALKSVLLAGWGAFSASSKHVKAGAVSLIIGISFIVASQIWITGVLSGLLLAGGLTLSIGIPLLLTVMTAGGRGRSSHHTGSTSAIGSDPVAATGRFNFTKSPYFKAFAGIVSLSLGITAIVASQILTLSSGLFVLSLMSGIALVVVPAFLGIKAIIEVIMASRRGAGHFHGGSGEGDVNADKLSFIKNPRFEAGVSILLGIAGTVVSQIAGLSPGLSALCLGGGIILIARPVTLWMLTKSFPDIFPLKRGIAVVTTSLGISGIVASSVAGFSSAFLWGGIVLVTPAAGLMVFGMGSWLVGSIQRYRQGYKSPEAGDLDGEGEDYKERAEDAGKLQAVLGFIMSGNLYYKIGAAIVGITGIVVSQVAGLSSMLSTSFLIGGIVLVAPAAAFIAVFGGIVMATIVIPKFNEVMNEYPRTKLGALISLGIAAAVLAVLPHIGVIQIGQIAGILFSVGFGGAAIYMARWAYRFKHSDKFQYAPVMVKHTDERGHGVRSGVRNTFLNRAKRVAVPVLLGVAAIVASILIKPLAWTVLGYSLLTVGILTVAISTLWVISQRVRAAFLKIRREGLSLPYTTPRKDGRFNNDYLSPRMMLFSVIVGIALIAVAATVLWPSNWGYALLAGGATCIFIPCMRVCIRAFSGSGRRKAATVNYDETLELNEFNDPPMPTSRRSTQDLGLDSDPTHRRAKKKKPSGARFTIGDGEEGEDSSQSDTSIHFSGDDEEEEGPRPVPIKQKKSQHDNPPETKRKKLEVRVDRQPHDHHHDDSLIVVHPSSTSSHTPPQSFPFPQSTSHVPLSSERGVTHHHPAPTTSFPKITVNLEGALPLSATSKSGPPSSTSSLILPRLSSPPPVPTSPPISKPKEVPKKEKKMENSKKPTTTAAKTEDSDTELAAELAGLEEGDGSTDINVSDLEFESPTSSTSDSSTKKEDKVAKVIKGPSASALASSIASAIGTSTPSTGVGVTLTPPPGHVDLPVISSTGSSTINSVV